jgi:hypothetical protein
LIDERIKRAGEPRWHNIEPVGGACFEPFLQLIRNAFRSSPNRRCPCATLA